MEPPPRRYPGMTTRQAKAAYRKSGGSHITEVERRQILRGAELAERAAKIKEKERKKKENKKKREEKEVKEKERRRTYGKESGLANPVKWKSSQRGIGDFLGKINVSTGAGDNLIDHRKDGQQQNKMVDQVQDVEAPAANELRSLSDRKPLQDLSLNSARPRPQTLQAEKISHNCPKLWDDDWAALVPSNTQIARELNSPEADDTPRHEIVTPPPSCTKHNVSQILPKDLSNRAIRSSVLLPPPSDCGIPFISTQDSRFLEEGLEETSSPKLKRKATTPPTISSPSRPTSNDLQRPPKRIKSSPPPLKLSHASAPVNEKPPQPAKLPDDSTSLQLNKIPVPTATQYCLISTQDLLESDLGLTEPSPVRPRPSQTSQSSFGFGEEDITDEDLLGLDILGPPSNGSVHPRLEG